MRTYEKTHPWLTFKVDLQNAAPKLWMLLGEAASKCEHIAGVPLRPSTATALHRLYIAKGALATTAIEGNTLTEKEVLQHLEGKLKLPPSKEYLAQEIDNIVAACNKIGERLRIGDDKLTPSHIAEFNKQVLDKLTLDKGMIPGDIRAYSVVVGNMYRGAPQEDCQYLLERLCDWLSGTDFEPPKGLETAYAIIKAIIAHVYIAWIHPYGDGNGRTARLVEFQILLAAGIPTPVAHLLSNHYNITRNEYYRQLDQTSKSGGNLTQFVEYAVQGLVDGLHEQLQVILDQTWDVVWRNYVHEQFRDNQRIPKRRLRDLVLDLSQTKGPVAISKISDITPRIAKYYSKKTEKTLQRDINALLKMGLIEKTPEGIRAKRELILAFLPWRKISTQ